YQLTPFTGRSPVPGGEARDVHVAGPGAPVVSRHFAAPSCHDAGWPSIVNGRPSQYSARAYPPLSTNRLNCSFVTSNRSILNGSRAIGSVVLNALRLTGNAPPG